MVVAMAEEQSFDTGVQDSNVRCYDGFNTIVRFTKRYHLANRYKLIKTKKNLLKPKLSDQEFNILNSTHYLKIIFQLKMYCGTYTQWITTQPSGK